MLHRRKAIDRPAGHTLSWRIRGNKLGMGRFELPQAEKATVVLGVREFRVVQHVVLLVSTTNLRPQLVDFLDDPFGQALWS